ncbi:MAG: FtsK/SpoIIIE domain-containing protein, partial [Acidobacteriota bacterium]
MPLRLLRTPQATGLARTEASPAPVLLGHTIDSGGPFTLTPADLSAHMLVSGITGGGKSRFLTHLLQSHVDSKRPLFLLDPTGALFRSSQEIVADRLARTPWQAGRPRPDQLLRSHLFLDLEDDSNPLRINPLAASTESPEELAGDLLEALQRLVQTDLTSQARRLLTILSSAFVILAELNRLPARQRPPFPGAQYPLNLYDLPLFLAADETIRARLVQAVPDSPTTRFAKSFFLGQFASYTDSQRAERTESTLNLLSPVLSSSLVARLFDCRHSTLDIPTLLRDGISLYTHIPLGRSLQASQAAGLYLLSKLQRATFRRPQHERRCTYYGLIDEVQHFVTHEFASGFASLRQFGLFFTVVHQDQHQHPFETAEGRAILESIRANTRLKILFSQNRPDAEALAKSLFRLSQREGFEFEEQSSGWDFSSSRTFGRTTTRSRSQSRSQSQSWNRSIAHTDGLTVSRSRGTTTGETLTQGLSSSIADGLAEAVSVSESDGVTIAESEEQGLTLTLGENFSHLVDRTTGVSFTESQGEGLALMHGESQAHAEGVSEDHTTTEGTSQGASRSWQETHSCGSEQSSSRTQGQHVTESSTSSKADSERTESGTSLVHSTRFGGLHFRDEPSSRSNREGTSLTRQETDATTLGSTEISSASSSRSHSQSHAETHGLSESEAKNYSEAIRLARSATESIGRSRSQTRSEQSSNSKSHSEGHGERFGLGNSISEG